MHPYWRANTGEIIYPLGVGLEHVDTAMRDTLAHITGGIAHPPGFVEGVTTSLPVSDIMDVT